MLLGELDLGGAGFLKTIDGLDKGLGNFVGSLGKLGGVLAGSFAAFAAIGTVMDGFRETLNLGGTLQDLSTSTGEAVSDLVILRQAFDNAGLGASAAGDFLLKLQDSIAGVNADGKSTAGALAALGVSADGLRNLPGLDQIEKLQDGFAKIADQSTKVQVARDLFGKSGGKALALFGDTGALDAARNQAGPLAGVMERNVEVFDRLGDVLNALKLNFLEFSAGALSQIAPQATSIADALANINFVGIGEAVGSITGVFLKFAEVLSKLAPYINSFSEGLGSLFGGGSAPSTDLAERYKGFSRTAMGELGMEGGSPVSALQRIGGGGGFGGATGTDSIVNEQKVHTRLLERIAERVGRESGSSTPVPV